MNFIFTTVIYAFLLSLFGYRVFTDNPNVHIVNCSTALMIIWVILLTFAISATSSTATKNARKMQNYLTRIKDTLSSDFTPETKTQRIKTFQTDDDLVMLLLLYTKKKGFFSKIMTLYATILLLAFIGLVAASGYIITGVYLFILEIVGLAANISNKQALTNADEIRKLLANDIEGSLPFLDAK